MNGNKKSWLYFKPFQRYLEKPQGGGAKKTLTWAKADYGTNAGRDIDIIFQNAMYIPLVIGTWTCLAKMTWVAKNWLLSIIPAG